MAKNYTPDLTRLCAAMQSARLTLRFPRKARKDAVSHYAGSNWSEENRQRDPVNLLSLYVSVVGRNLISKNPRVMLSTFDMASKPAVKAMESWLNKEIVDMKFANTMRRVVQDALFSIGITKVALASPAESALSAWNVDAGQPFVRNIDLDDFVFDIHARDFSECSFIGHRYRVPLAAIMDDKKNYKRGRKDLTASTDQRFNQEGDERINVMFRGYYGNDEEIEDMVDLWEVYLPRHKIVLTLSEDCLTGAMAPAHGGDPEALRTQPWIGPDCGPYHILGFKQVPGNILPAGPIQDLIDLHIPLNQVMRKLIDQAWRQKDNTFISRGQDGDAERLRNSRDGEIVPVDSPEKIAKISQGGPNPALFQFFMQLKDIFSWMAGNLDIMGGLSPQAKTAHQDEMLNQNSSRSISDMQDTTLTYTTQVLESMAWYHWHDPVSVQKAPYSVPGMPSMTRTQNIHPWNAKPNPQTGKKPLTRSAPWETLQLGVDPYSMAHTTPQQRAADLDSMVKGVFIPMAQMLQQQGVQFDINAYLEFMAKYRDMPDLPSIATMRVPPAGDHASDTDSGQAAPQQPKEPTTNTRISMPGRTRQGNDLNLQNALAGVNAGGASNGQANGQMATSM